MFADERALWTNLSGEVLKDRRADTVLAAEDAGKLHALLWYALGPEHWAASGLPTIAGGKNQMAGGRRRRLVLEGAALLLLVESARSPAQGTAGDRGDSLSALPPESKGAVLDTLLDAVDDVLNCSNGTSTGLALQLPGLVSLLELLLEDSVLQAKVPASTPVLLAATARLVRLQMQVIATLSLSLDQPTACAPYWALYGLHAVAGERVLVPEITTAKQKGSAKLKPPRAPLPRGKGRGLEDEGYDTADLLRWERETQAYKEATQAAMRTGQLQAAGGSDKSARAEKPYTAFILQKCALLPHTLLRHAGLAPLRCSPRILLRPQGPKQAFLWCQNAYYPAGTPVQACLAREGAANLCAALTLRAAARAVKWLRLLCASVKVSKEDAALVTLVTAYYCYRDAVTHSLPLHTAQHQASLMKELHTIRAQVQTMEH
jgi:hypothetical protein